MNIFKRYVCVCDAKFRKESEVVEHSKTCSWLYSRQHPIKHCFREETLTERMGDLLLNRITLTILRALSASLLWSMMNRHLGIHLSLKETILAGVCIGIFAAVVRD